jgi:hypothetical protein
MMATHLPHETGKRKKKTMEAPMILVRNPLEYWAFVSTFYIKSPQLFEWDTT